MAEQKNSQHVVAFFRYRMNDLSAAEREEYNSTAERLYAIASAMPGFVSYREYEAHDGELLGMTEWASAEALSAWREHPEHRKAQDRGRKIFYSEYEITICAPLHKYDFKSDKWSAQ